MSDLFAGQVFREAAEGVPVGQPPVHEIVGLARTRQRRRNQWAGGALVLALVVVAGGTWLATRPPPGALPDVTVHSESNPANLAWYADGVLHLPRVTVDVGQVIQLVEVPDGVVYADRPGRVVLVESDGTLTSLGRKATGTPLVASSERGWVGWLEPGSLPSLVVHDTVTRQELARRTVAPTTRPIAIDQDRLYYNQHGESWSWQLPDITPALVPNTDLFDVAAAVRVQRAEPGRMQIRQPLLATNVVVPGSEAVLSPDGRYVLTRLDLDQPQVIRIYDADGDAVTTGLADNGSDGGEIALAAAFGPDETISYVVGSRQHGTDGDDLLRLSESMPYDLRTCELPTGTCTIVTQVSGEHGVPVLPTN